MRQKLRRIVYVGLGHLALITGIIGIVVPLLPTTPFILLACWCYAKGSPTLHAKMLASRRFGPTIREWEEHRAINTQAKIIAVIMIALGIGWGVIVVPLVLVKIVMGIVGIAVSLFIITRPSGKRKKKSDV